jgi:hypothetical protein
MATSQETDAPQNYEECIVILEELKTMNASLRQENSTMRDENRLRSEMNSATLERIERKLAEESVRRPVVRRARSRKRQDELTVPAACRVSKLLRSLKVNFKLIYV